MRTTDDFTKILNQSGFPLQMAVERLINDGDAVRGWKVVYREHGWQSDEGQSGFIDLVLENSFGTSVLILELKRMREAHLLFLADIASTRLTPDTRLWITSQSNGKPFFGHFDAMTFPESPQSMFCVVDGQDARARPMLERVSSELVASTEALALEERAVINARGHGLRMYASVIVTTADLLISAFDTSSVKLATGTVLNATHEPQRWVRFRKHLSPSRRPVAVNAGDDFESLSAAKERLVFVVNAEHLPAFLNEWRVLDHSLRPLM